MLMVFLYYDADYLFLSIDELHSRIFSEPFSDVKFIRISFIKVTCA